RAREHALARAAVARGGAHAAALAGGPRAVRDVARRDGPAGPAVPGHVAGLARARAAPVAADTVDAPHALAVAVAVPAGAGRGGGRPGHARAEGRGRKAAAVAAAAGQAGGARVVAGEVPVAGAGLGRRARARAVAAGGERERVARAALRAARAGRPREGA